MYRYAGCERETGAIPCRRASAQVILPFPLSSYSASASSPAAGAGAAPVWDANPAIDDKLRPKIEELTRNQDGTEINAHELELKTDHIRNLNDRRDAFEQLRDHATEHYTHHTASVWRPRTGSHTSFSRRLTAAAIDARDYTRARDAAKT